MNENVLLIVSDDRVRQMLKVELETRYAKEQIFAPKSYRELRQLLTGSDRFGLALIDGDLSEWPQVLTYKSISGNVMSVLLPRATIVSLASDARVGYEMEYEFSRLVAEEERRRFEHVGKSVNSLAKILDELKGKENGGSKKVVSFKLVEPHESVVCCKNCQAVGIKSFYNAEGLDRIEVIDSTKPARFLAPRIIPREIQGETGEYIPGKGWEEQDAAIELDRKTQQLWVDFNFDLLRSYELARA